MAYSSQFAVQHGDATYNKFLTDNWMSNFIYGYSGNDIVTADDTDFYNGPGLAGFYTDYFDGGTDYDIVNYKPSTTPVDVDLADKVGYRLAADGGKYAPDILLNFEGAWGSNHDDKLKGDGFNNTFSAGDGDDQIQGRGGDDHLLGRDGNDWINGGADDDVLEGGAGDDDLIGGAHDDTLRGGRDDDDIWTGSGADTVRYGIGDHVGTDTIHDFELGVDRVAFDSYGLFWQTPGEDYPLSDVLMALSVWGGDPNDSWLVAQTKEGLATLAKFKGVSAAALQAAIDDQTLIDPGAVVDVGWGLEIA